MSKEKDVLGQKQEYIAEKKGIIIIIYNNSSACADDILSKILHDWIKTLIVAVTDRSNIKSSRIVNSK